MKNSNNKSVLFLALSGIGNLVMQLPTIEAVKKEHPNWHTVVWVAPRGTRELAYSQWYIDEVIEMPIRTGIVQHAKNIFELRKRAFGIGIVLSPGQLLKSAAYIFLSGIPVRIGNSYPFRGNKHVKLFLTYAVNERNSLHDIEQNLALLSPIVNEIPKVTNYEINIASKNIQEAKSLFSQNKSYIGIHTGSAEGFEWKRWPLDRFSIVAHELFSKDATLRFAIFGSHSEQHSKQQLVNEINTLCKTTVAYNITASLMTTAASIQHCALFLSNDSGLMHIAAAVGVPTIGLFGPTDEHQTGPRGPHSFVVRAPGTKAIYNTEHSYNLGKEPYASMLAITPRIVVDNIYKILL